MAKPTDSDVAEPASSPLVRGGLSIHTFAAFRSVPFRLLWFNTLSFVLSQSVRQFAFVWLALDLGGSGRSIGLVAFGLGIPILFFGLPAGALTDRLDRRVLLFSSQIAALGVSTLAAVLIWADVVNVGIAFLLALALGTTMAFGQPVRQAIVPSIVEPDRLLNAVTLIGMAQNASQIIGPAFAGLMIALFGIGSAFAFQAVLLAVGLVTLVPLRVPPPTGQKENMARELREGFSFVIHHPGIRTLFIALLATSATLGGAFTTLLPKIAKEDLGVDAFGTSILLGLMGVGMLMSSLVLASLYKLERAGLAFNMTLIAGMFLNVVVGLSPWYTLTALMLFLIGWNAGFYSNLNLTLVQGHTDHHVMGRVMSIYVMCQAGGIPFGALLAGFGADFMGAQDYYVVSALAFGVLGLYVFFFQPSLRRMRVSRTA